MAATKQKRSGAYFTPADVAGSLVRWAARDQTDRMLDPSCGDGEFLSAHGFSVGVEQDPISAAVARQRAPSALVHAGDFFTWAAETEERFECAAGNPPFIRYQTFGGPTRERAQKLCASVGALFSGLASSWAPFLVAAASLLKPGGRMAFVVPAEIGHAPYAAPLLEYLIANFERVQVVAIREKLFPDLSEDCWLLFADGAGGRADAIAFTVADRFESSAAPPRPTLLVTCDEWRTAWNRRLRPFLMQAAARDLYREVAGDGQTRRLGEIASVGIGYVSGANDFFHLRPSVAANFDIPRSILRPSVRNGRALPQHTLTSGLVETWLAADEPILLLQLEKRADLPTGVRRYLDTKAGQRARTGYKCRMRTPWWSVPDVRSPDMFLTYMSGRGPSLVRNAAGCTGTNSIHYVQLRSCEYNPSSLVRAFETPFVQLSCEIEGHPLGGGMLKLEPREAGRILFPSRGLAKSGSNLQEGLALMRHWRHCANQDGERQNR